MVRKEEKRAAKKEAKAARHTRDEDALPPPPAPQRLQSPSEADVSRRHDHERGGDGHRSGDAGGSSAFRGRESDRWGAWPAAAATQVVPSECPSEFPLNLSAER